MNQSLLVLVVVAVIGVIGGIAGNIIHTRNIRPVWRPNFQTFTVATGPGINPSLGWIADGLIGALIASIVFAGNAAVAGKTLVPLDSTLTLSFALAGLILVSSLGGSKVLEDLIKPKS